MFSFFRESQTLSKKKSAFFQNFSSRIVKTVLYVSGRSIRKKTGKLFLSYRFRTLRETCLAFGQSLFSLTLKIVFYMSIETVRTFSNEESSPKKIVFNIFLEHWANLFQPFPATFSGVGKTESSETREHFDELFSLENGLLIQVWSCTNFFLASCKNFNKNLSKSH